MASSLARLGAARIPPRGGRWDSAAVAASRPASLYGWRCQAHSDVKASPAAELKDGGNSSQNWRIKMLYDGECPLCMREVNMLRERNKSYGAIHFVDISSKDYSTEDNQGLDYETAFRRLYEEVGLGWVYAVTKYEPVDLHWRKFLQLGDKRVNVKMIKHARCEQQSTRLLYSDYFYFDICLDRHTYIHR